MGCVMDKGPAVAFNVPLILAVSRCEAVLIRRLAVALDLLILDELIPSGTECECVDGLKSHHAPRFTSSHIFVTMPATVPDAEQFNGVELILVTQLVATQPIHRVTYKEVARISDMAKNRKGKLGVKAKEALKLRHSDQNGAPQSI